jgi:AcrR family transcriptional regulator
VESAWQVVAAEGVRGATVRNIAAAAGVSTGFITHYFEDKHELIVDVLRHNNARAQRRVAAATRKSPGLEGVRAAAEAVLPLDPVRRREWQVWVACWEQASPGDELAAGLRMGWDGLRQLIAALLEQAREQGELRPKIDVSFEADRLVTVLAGVGLLAGVESPGRVRVAAERIVDEQLAALDGVGAQPVRRVAAK